MSTSVKQAISFFTLLTSISLSFVYLPSQEGEKQLHNQKYLVRAKTIQAPEKSALDSLVQYSTVATCSESWTTEFPYYQILTAGRSPRTPGERKKERKNLLTI